MRLEHQALCKGPRVGVTWSGLLWYRKLKRCPMVTHSSRSSFSGRACSSGASTWTHGRLWPLAPHAPQLPGFAWCPPTLPGAPVSSWDWPSAGGQVPHRCCHGHDHGVLVPGGAAGAPAVWGSVWSKVKEQAHGQTAPLPNPRAMLPTASRPPPTN